MTRRYKVTDSSNIAEQGYDAIERVLEVKFKSSPDKLYRYKNVDSRTYLEMISSKSQGSYFNHTIAKHPDKYPFDREHDVAEVQGLTVQQSFQIAAEFRLALEVASQAIDTAQAAGAPHEIVQRLRAIVEALSH